MKILNDEQLDAFLSAVEQDPIWKDFFYTELTTGLRLGEICGLMWSDFDPRKGTLSVNRTIHKEKGGRLVTGDTKTYAGTRKIVLPDSTAELLRCRKKNSYSVWIFPNPIKPEAPMNPSTAYHQLKKLLEENGPPDLRFHDLRHPYVKPTTKKFASFLKFFRAAAIAARSCSIRYSWLMLPFQISPFLKSPA